MLRLFEKKSTKKLILFILTIFFCLYTPFTLIKDIGTEKAAMTLSAADSFYYLKVGDNFAHTGMFSYDGTHPTNGFHPLWQFIVGSVCSVSPYHPDQISMVFYLSILLVTIAFCGFAQFIYKVTQNAALSLLSVFPGFFYIILSVVDQKYFTVWSYMNSMETVISLFVFSIALTLIHKYELLRQEKYSSLILLTTLFSIMTLCRLDDIFIFVPYFIHLFLKSSNFKEFLKKSAISSIPPIIFIGSYLVFNIVSCGMLLPVSASVKGTIALINIPHLFNVFIPVWIFFPDRINNWTFWLATSLRVMQVFLPLLIASIVTWKWFELKRIKSLRSRLDSGSTMYFLGFFLIYVVCKSLYNFIFVNIWNQGHWYFPVSIVIINITMAYVISRYIKPSKFLFVASIFIVLLISNKFANLVGSGTDTQYMNKALQSGVNISLWENRQRIVDTLDKIDYGKGFIEIDDGVLAYSLDKPAISGFGFCMDKEAVKNFKAGTFLDLAYSRGYRSLASVFYSGNDTCFQSSASIKRYVAGFLNSGGKENLDKWDFNLLYRDSVSGFKIIGFHPLVTQ